MVSLIVVLRVVVLIEVRAPAETGDCLHRVSLLIVLSIAGRKTWQDGMRSVQQGLGH